MDHYDRQDDLAESADTEEIVMIGDLVLDAGREPVYYMWRAAHVDAQRAWASWRDTRDASAYLAYQAALDREDAAQHALALGASRSSRRVGRPARGPTTAR
jgi:hypothetical protein